MVDGLRQRLKIERIKMSLSQKEVSERTGIKESSISSYESGGTTPPGESLIKLAKLYNVTTDYLYGLDQQQIIVIDGLTEQQKTAVNLIVSEFKRANEQN